MTSSATQPATLETPAAAPTPVLTLEHIHKAFGATAAVDDASLEVPTGEILALVGPSGCGKSTLLRIAAGLLRADAGRVRVHGELVDGDGRWVPAESRQVGMVFQDLALFPHLSVADNVGFGLGESARRRLPGSESYASAAQRRARVAELLELVSLAHLAERYPHELSGGEQQRVALARALAPRPAVVLLDEPFSGLDRNLRERLRTETVDVLRLAGVTAVLVTHDREEAMVVGDRIAVLHGGRLAQVDEPTRVFHAPTDRFVATFMGEADFLPAVVEDGGVVTEVGAAPRPETLAAGACVDILVRPHEVGLAAEDAGNATVVRAELAGAHVRYELCLDSGRRLQSLQPHTLALPAGSRVRAWIDHGHAPAWFPTETAAR